MSIDYSKWDHIDDDSSSSDSPKRQQYPRVTRLDKPTRVTCNPQGEVLFQQDPEPKYSAQTAEPSVRQSSTKQDDWTRKGAAILDPKIYPYPLYWSQDRTTCTLRILLDKDINTKHLNCQVTHLISYAERNSSTTSSTLEQDLLVTCSKTVLLQDRLVYPVHVEENEEGVDWSIQRLENGAPVLMVVLWKATPMQGMALWWKRPMQKCPAAEWKQDDSASQASKDFQAAWNQANEEFRKR